MCNLTTQATWVHKLRYTSQVGCLNGSGAGHNQRWHKCKTTLQAFQPVPRFRAFHQDGMNVSFPVFPVFLGGTYRAKRCLVHCPSLTGRCSSACEHASALHVQLWQHSRAPPLSAPEGAQSGHQRHPVIADWSLPHWQSAAPKCHRTPAVQLKLDAASKVMRRRKQASPCP